MIIPRKPHPISQFTSTNKYTHPKNIQLMNCEATNQIKRKKHIYIKKNPSKKKDSRKRDNPLSNSRRRNSLQKDESKRDLLNSV